MSEAPWLSPEYDIIADIRDNINGLRKRRAKVSKTIAIVSGGLDSTTMIYHLMHEGYDVDLVSFDYGQRHKKELRYAAAIARQLGLFHDIVDLTGLTHLISNSALTSPFVDDTEPFDADLVDYKRDIEVPDGHYAEETMKATVVPNRNMIMLSIAAGIAVNRGASSIATAVHAGDHFIYPDCRPTFIDSCSRTIAKGNEGFSSFKQDPSGTYDEPVIAPFIMWSKADIVYRAMELNVPLHLTWSCYKGSENHCGRCGTCVERLEAIDEAVRRHISNNTEHYYEDQTTYDDKEFWRTAVKEAK